MQIPKETGSELSANQQREDPERGRAAVTSWQTGAASPALIENLAEWARERKIAAVVWTALGPKFADESGRVPSLDEVISYLRARQGEEGRAAEEYVRYAPKQINTRYRQRIAAELDWMPRDPPRRRRVRRRKE